MEDIVTRLKREGQQNLEVIEQVRQLLLPLKPWQQEVVIKIVGDFQYKSLDRA